MAMLCPQKLPESSLPIAKQLKDQLAASANPHVRITITVVGNQAKETELPLEIAHVLETVLSAMAQGQPLYLIPADTEVSSQVAADMLGVSRKFLNEKLLDTGIIPCYKVGKHRRVKFASIQNYKELRQYERQRDLDALTALEQELGLDD
jgi:excisionase family DNA binding protein